MRFVVVDVETANSKFSSICQIGLVRFENGREAASEELMVNPQAEFSPMNVGIHGICEADVSGSPCFVDLYPRLKDWVGDAVVVSHSAFDRTAMNQACDRYALEAFAWSWLDSARIARRTWDQFKDRGYGLRNLADHFGIGFNHHNAVHDARTAGLILLRALEHSGRSFDDVVAETLAGARGSASYAASVRRAGDGDGALTGEAIVFTGELELPRAKAADMAAAAVADVHSGITKKTTMLVVGERDLQPGWPAKSGKHRKAESLIAAGQRIRVVGERDFMALASISE